MHPFTAPLDDIMFSLDHVAGAPDLPDWDSEFAREIGAHFAAFAEGEIAPLNGSGDAEGCKLVDGRVQMPDGFKAVYDAYVEQGWPGLVSPEEYGGQGQGELIRGITSEIFIGANQAFQMCTALAPGAVRTIMAFGTDDQKQCYIPALTDGSSLATMCLTEPGAGSDLGRIRCKAVEGDTSWEITGEKIFITGGDQDLSPKITHLVLARTSDYGVKGLSLFLCPSHLSDGSRNAVNVTRIEEKMGLHASPTCQMAFDGAKAELVGAPGQGLMVMFTMMNHARVDVALQGAAQAARAYDVAASYAAERVQGRGADGQPVTIDQHADMRRMLDRMDALALGSRAIAHITMVAMERGDSPDLVEFLTPIAKVHNTESGIKGAEMGVQVLGGYGYLTEYTVEQTYRDIRISAIYEGTNAIHERALVSRLLTSAPSDAFVEYITGRAADEAVSLWTEMRETVLSSGNRDACAHDFMALTIEVLLQAIWPILIAKADQHPNPERIKRVAQRAQKTGLITAKYRADLIRAA